MNTPSKELSRIRNWIFFGAFVVLGLWAVTPYAIEKISGTNDRADKGQVGDQFGSINALFSGLAFIGVAAALYLQAKEIRTQNEEHHQTVNALVNAVYARSFDKIYDVLDDGKVVEARKKVLSLDGKPYEQWKTIHDWKELEREIKVVLRAYNIAAIIVENGYLPADHLIPHWEPSIRDVWRILKPYVTERRKERKSDNHWASFERLAQKAESYVSNQRG